MKKTILIAATLSAGIATNATDNKLYLAAIECTSHDWDKSSDYTYKSLFQYDGQDNVVQIDIFSHTKKYIADKYMTLPESVLFTFGYDGEILKTAKYTDSNDKTLEGTVTTSLASEGKVIKTIMSGSDLSSDKTFQTEYNSNGEIIRYECQPYLDEESIFTYQYNYDENGKLFEIVIRDNDGFGNWIWYFEYGESGEITKCNYSDGRVNTPIITYLELSYYDAEDFDSATNVITPAPIQFIYDTLFENMPESMIGAHTLYIPECIATLIGSQNNKYIKTITEFYGHGCKGYTFEFKYQSERPTAGMEDALADIDAAPEYYNIQGMRVANPTEGEIYIVKRGTSASKEVYRR